MMQRMQDLTLHATQVRAPKKLDEKQRALMQAYAELEPGKIVVLLVRLWFCSLLIKTSMQTRLAQSMA